MAGSVIAFLGSLWYQKKAQTGFLGAFTSFFLRLPFSAAGAAFLASLSDFALAKSKVRIYFANSNQVPKAYSPRFKPLAEALR